MNSTCMLITREHESIFVFPMTAFVPVIRGQERTFHLRNGDHDLTLLMRITSPAKLKGFSAALGFH